MSDFEVPEAIICSPFEEPTYHWRLEEGTEPEKRPGRRPAIYYYPDPSSSAGTRPRRGVTDDLSDPSIMFEAASRHAHRHVRVAGAVIDKRERDGFGQVTPGCVLQMQMDVRLTAESRVPDTAEMLAHRDAIACLDHDRSRLQVRNDEEF